MAKYIFYALFLELLFTRSLTRDPVSEQLQNYRDTHNGSTIIQTQFGAPVPDATSSLTVGPRGPMLLQDVVFLEVMASFDRERIPERVVHAKGAGAFGYFEVTKDITRYTKATVFKSVGKRTRIAVRFSTTGGETGSAETVRDVYGFSIKFYSDDGIWDLVGVNNPIFFISDSMLFPSLVHVLKRNPVTNIRDADMFWDFMISRPETTHQLLRLYSDIGIPDGFRHMNGYGSNTFKMVNAAGKPVYVKFHYLTDQGIKTLTSARATQLAGTDPDYATRDLYNAIALRQFPSWTFYIQVMTFEQAEKFRWNPFDVTKIWPEDEFPLIEAGKLVLNENPENYFEQVEQIALCPANMIPGIEPSPDKMLQGRLFSYSDTQRYRLGVNHLQLPVNCPFGSRGLTNYQRDGHDALYNQDGAPNYYPNSFGGPQNVPSAAISRFSVSGDVARYNSSNEDNFSQATMFWNTLTAKQKKNLEMNIGEHLKMAAPFLQKGNTIIQTQSGAPVPDATSSLTVGPRGPMLLQDVIFLEVMASFDRERIPERVVHAKGAGAFGYFEVTKDITRYTKATVFKPVGKRTRIAVRFSTTGGETGSADTVRDVYGFSIKFYSDDGIWDLVGVNNPIFFISDSMLFPSLVHVLKRNPVTNIRDADMFWDFMTSRPETTHQLLRLYSDIGIPDGFRHMNGYGSNTFKMVNAAGKPVYVKFHYLTDQGIKTLTSATATALAGTDPDYATRDLYNAIALRQFPSWTFYIQVMTFEQAESFRWNPFDVTKIWPEDEFPLIEAGKLVLNENPENYFEQVEQIALRPDNMIPGIEPSPDKMLQGRLFSYSDTQRYRLGVNHLQLPVNCPFGSRGMTNYKRDGHVALYNQDGAPNYYPNSFGGPQNVPSAAISRFSVSGDVARYNSSNEDNFSQATMFWNTLTAKQKKNLEKNIGEHLKMAAPFLQERATDIFGRVHGTFGQDLKRLLQLA